MNTIRGRRRLPRIRILFDATYAHRPDGTGRYTRETLRCLREDPDLVVLALRAPRIRRLPGSLHAAINGLLHVLFSQAWLPVMAVVRQAHIVHTMAVAPWFCRRPVIVTIHDALDFYPRYRPSRLWSAYVRTIGTIGARRADAIVTVSQTSADEIARHFRVPRTKLHVIPNAFALTGIYPSLVSQVGSKRYVLFVGDDSARKNLSTAIAALEVVRQRLPDVQLVVCGNVRPRFMTGRPWLIAIGGVSDSELVWLYQNAAAVIVSSHYEGFSLPVIEALAFGTPVVASDIPAHREVGAGAVSIVSPGDACGFAARLEEVLTGPEPVDTAAVSTPVLTWERSEEKLVDLYLSLLHARLGVAP